jgi:hypothetical protein
MVEQRDNQTIRSNASLATARRVIRAHIRTPLAGLAWSLGIPQGNMLVGFVLGRRLRASLVPKHTTLGRQQDSLIVRGRIIPCQDGGSEVRLSVYRPRFFRVIAPIGIAIFSAAFIVGYIATGRTVFLLALGVGVIWQLYVLAIRRLNRHLENGELALYHEWIDAVTHDLQRSDQVDDRALHVESQLQPDR